jgi:hypothetical protein
LRRGTPAAAQEGARALDQHQRAERAEQHHVAEIDHQLDLAEAAQDAEQPDAEQRAEKAADQEDAAHLEIDVAAPPMRQHARHRGADELVGRRGDGDRRRHADEDEEGGEQEAAADAEHAGEEADPAAKGEQDEDIQRDLGDR